jgi:hypothetical protein
MNAKCEATLNGVSCGHNKWSISFDEENRALNIEFAHHPNYGTITLHDVTAKELEQLGAMFTLMSRKLQWESHQLKGGPPGNLGLLFEYS